MPETDSRVVVPEPRCSGSDEASDDRTVLPRLNRYRTYCNATLALFDGMSRVDSVTILMQRPSNREGPLSVLGGTLWAIGRTYVRTAATTAR